MSCQITEALKNWHIPAVLERASPGTVVKGRYEPGEKSYQTIMVVIHPATGTELMKMPEGLRTLDPMVVYTTTELHTTDVSASKIADVINVRGEKYQVEQLVSDWQIVGGFTTAVVVKQGQGE